MLKRRKISGSNTVKVSFILPADDAAWDDAAAELQREGFAYLKIE